MSYEYATENINYEDFASGRVLYNQKGTTSFPARLISEIFMRCEAILEKQGKAAPYSIYDPLCGGAYSLTILGCLHGQNINKLVASDVDEAVVGFAAKNLSLLTSVGIGERISQIQLYIDEYGKDSHREALISARQFQEIINHRHHKLEISCYRSDALKQCTEQEQEKYDMIITDVPYGELVDWNSETGEDAINLLLENMLPKLKEQAVVAISSQKKTTIQHDNYKRVDKFKIGKRQVVILQPIK